MAEQQALIPPEISLVIKRVLQRVDDQRAFIDAFRCPLPDPHVAIETMPCSPGEDGAPIIEGPSVFAPCPQWELVKCVRYVEWLHTTEERARKAWEKEALHIGIPRRHWAMSFETAEPWDAIRGAREFFDRDVQHRRCLRLMGPNGRGKTSAAVSLLRALTGRDRMFVHYPSFANRLMSAETRTAALEMVKRTEIVVFDDFGSEYLPSTPSRGTVPTHFLPMLMAFFDEVIWHRYENVMTTIITTKLAPEQFGERVTDNVNSRLGTDWCVDVECPGEDMRHG